jgi:hypothetical protein
MNQKNIGGMHRAGVQCHGDKRWRRKEERDERPRREKVPGQKWVTVGQGSPKPRICLHGTCERTNEVSMPCPVLISTKLKIRYII